MLFRSCDTDGERVQLKVDRHRDMMPFITISLDDEVTGGLLSVHVGRADIRRLRDMLGDYLERTERHDDNEDFV